MLATDEKILSQTTILPHRQLALEPSAGVLLSTGPDAALSGERTAIVIPRDQPRPRHAPPGRRPAWIEPFLAAYRESGVVAFAAKAARIDRTTAYARARRDPEFAAAWEAAEADATDALVLEARRRAMEGSDQLLMFLIRGLKPEVFGGRVEVGLDVRPEAERIAERLGVPVEVVIARVDAIAKGYAR